jgi:hypothetical protein
MSEGPIINYCQEFKMNHTAIELEPNQAKVNRASTSFQLSHVTK